MTLEWRVVVVSDDDGPNAVIPCHDENVAAKCLALWRADGYTRAYAESRVVSPWMSGHPLTERQGMLRTLALAADNADNPEAADFLRDMLDKEPTVP